MLLQQHFNKVICVAVMLIATVAQVMAADVNCYSRGAAYCILNDGSGNYPISAAGEVFVTTSADATPQYEAGEYITETVVNVGNATTGTVKQTFYFYARAKAGYKFIGWASTSTSKTGNGEEGVALTKTLTHWAAGTEEQPKEQRMYAVFEKEEAAPVTTHWKEAGLPTYTVISSTPEDNGEQRSAYMVTFEMSHPDFSSPIGIIPDADKITATKNINGSVTDVEGDIKPSVKDGKLIIEFTEPVAEECEVTLHVPAAITNNLLMPIAMMSAEELLAAGGCTNPELTLTFSVKPVIIPFVEIVNQSNHNLIDGLIEASVDDEKETGDMVTHIFVKYEEEMAKAIASADFGKYVTITRRETGENISISLYSNGLGMLFDGVRDYHYVDIVISSEKWINNINHLGTYDVEILPGLAQTVDGMKSAGASFTFNYVDITTGINKTEAQPAIGGNACFNLMGQRVGNDTKGLKIVNGRKVLK